MSNRTHNSDPVFQRFLERQFEEGTALAQSSDLLDLSILPAAPPHVVAEFHCTGLVRKGDGEVTEANQFHVGIWFPSDYLRRADTFQILRLFTPDVWHPNVSRELPLICVGRLTPGTPLVDIVYQVFDMLTYQKYNPREYDALNKAACQWARGHQDRLPVDRRPLKRQPLSLEVRPL